MVDAEIFVPELVESKDLCPHQDYIYFSSPSIEELGLIGTFRREVKTFMKELLEDDEFTTALTNHPCLINPEENMEAILDFPKGLSQYPLPFVQ